ncbi:MAG: diguanylate cyclase [Myxococcota bacterium]|nr:diguanylate cyclase [Myxococcota bacterium]
MSNETKNTSIISKSDLVKVGISCQNSSNIQDVIHGISEPILSIPGVGAIAVAIHAGRNNYLVYSRTNGHIDSGIALIINDQIHRHLEEVSGQRQINCHSRTLPSRLVNSNSSSPRALWSVALGDENQPSGSLIIFTEDRGLFSADDLIDFRQLGRLAGSAIEQFTGDIIIPDDDILQAPQAPVLYFQVQHLAAIEAVFGEDQVNTVMNTVTDRIARAVPSVAVIARLGSGAIAVVLADARVDTSELAGACLRACRDIAIEEKVLIQMTSSTAIPTEGGLGGIDPLTPPAIGKVLSETA